MLFHNMKRQPRPFARDPLTNPKAGDIVRFNRKVVRTVTALDGTLVRYRGSQGGMGALSLTAWRLATGSSGVQTLSSAE